MCIGFLGVVVCTLSACLYSLLSFALCHVLLWQSVPVEQQTLGSSAHGNVSLIIQIYSDVNKL